MGWFWREDGEKELLGESDHHDDGGQDSSAAAEPTADDAEFENNDKDQETYRSEVVIERAGEFMHPVTVELVFADGDRLRQRWDGRDRWVRYVEIRPAKLESVEIDPDHLMVLDVDPLNNSRRLEPNRMPVIKMLVHLEFWLQNVFSLTSVVG